MRVIETEIDGVLILEPHLFHDDRGYFYESFSHREFMESVSDVTFVQDNQSKSLYGVLRGLHFQKPPFSQSKLVRVVSGRIMDVAVDIRKGSPTYGKHVSLELSAENCRQLFIPQGFAHGFVTLSQEAIVMYKCDNYYNKESESAILWNDKELAIDWQIAETELLISDKDRLNSYLSDCDSPFCYQR